MALLNIKTFSVFKIGFLCAIFVTDVCFSIIEAARSGCSNPLGMQNGVISDSQLSSLTYFNKNRKWAAFQARLHNTKAWCSNTNNNWYEYLQIDLQKVRHVSAIATQGVGYGVWSYYVETFVIKYSYDGVSWLIYEASNGADVTFTGNNDPDTVETNYFRETFVTRFLRIYPKTFHRDMCLRVELYGCSDQADDCSRYITDPTGSINSPGYPAGSYPTNKDCTWVISVGSSKYIALMFTHFDVYQGSKPNSCSDDFVELRNGLTDISYRIGGKYCNGNRSMLITTGRNIVRIHFLSGSASLSHKGFQIEYVSVTPGLDDVLAVKACNGDVLALNCSSYDHTIDILHAWYQLGFYSCGYVHHNTMTSSCPAFDAKSVIISKCQDYKECRISVSESLFGQSCPSDTARHQLEVFYQCTTPAPTLEPPTQTSTKAPLMTLPSTTNYQPSSHSFTGNTTGTPTLTPSTEPIVTMPTTTPSQIVVSVGTDVPSPTERASSRSVPPPVGGKEARMGGGMTTGTMAAVIVVVIAVLIISLLIVLFLIRKKRKKKAKGDCTQTVEFTPEREYSIPDNSARRIIRCPLDYSGNTNAYETVNILYQSADTDSPSEPNGSSNADVNEYASCSVTASLPKVTENPLYKGVAPPFNSTPNTDKGYELVKPPPPGEESPSDSPLPKGKSIHNPNYEKTLPFTTHEYAVPDVPDC